MSGEESYEGKGIFFHKDDTITKINIETQSQSPDPVSDYL